MTIREKLSDQTMLREAIERTDSIKEALLYMGLNVHTTNYRSFHEACKIHKITPKHHNFNKNPLGGKSPKPLKDLLCLSTMPLQKSTEIKRRIFKEGLLLEECSLCGLGPEWQDKPLVLQLDHINGNRLDHRIENLRIVCPSCHTQTDTHSAKNKFNKPSALQKQCKDCSDKIYRKSERCINCERERRITADISKITWPSVEELKRKLETSNYSALGRELGVSDNAIRARINRAKSSK